MSGKSDVVGRPRKSIWVDPTPTGTQVFLDGETASPRMVGPGDRTLNGNAFGEIVEFRVEAPPGTPVADLDAATLELSGPFGGTVILKVERALDETIRWSMVQDGTETELVAREADGRWREDLLGPAQQGSFRRRGAPAGTTEPLPPGARLVVRTQAAF
ncbi:MAG: hypothetical protein D6718_01135 [Acidobacteria bacterium]|nr:MAG: hypothetical protein D6718_01135 [Acidobacteriota bacterium]